MNESTQTNSETNNFTLVSKPMERSGAGGRKRHHSSNGSGGSEQPGSGSSTLGLQTNGSHFCSRSGVGNTSLSAEQTITGLRGVWGGVKRYLGKNRKQIMKRIIQILGTVGFALAMLLARKAPAADLLGKLTVAPFAALKGAEITGENTLGAGLDVGLGVNDFVSIHIANTTLELDGWRSSVVDETEVYGRADFTPFKSNPFVVYGKGGVTRNWDNQAWALGVGVGAQYNFTEKVGLGADYTVNAWFNGPEDKSSVARAFLQLSF